MEKKVYFIFSVVFFITISIFVVYFLFSKNIVIKPEEIKENNFLILENKQQKCLSDDEMASYKITKKKNEVSTADIIVFDKKSNQEKYRFQINLPIPDHYHPIELHMCGVYAVRSFGYDYNTRASFPGYKAEIWKYDYRGKGEMLALIAEDALGNLKGYKYFFSSDFRIDFQERYLILIKSYSNKDDYSLVIKDLTTKEDIFILLAKEIFNKYPNIIGNFNMREWTKDGRYFWGDIFDGADVLAFFRIEAGAWKWEIFEVPKGTMGGDALNSETGWVTYDDGAPWTGDADFDQINREKWQKEGKKVHFYLYNLFTKKQIFLETIDDPTHSFAPHWLSNTELQYELTGGEKKVYKISKNN